MRGKTVRAVFGGGRYAETDSVTQYDYGQMLVFADIELPAVYEVFFAKGYGKAVKQIGGADGVRIPDAMLNSSGMISAWVFLHEGPEDGETEFTVRIPVAGRSEDSGEEPTPEEQSVITEAIAALNAAVAQTGQDAANANRDADRAEQAANTAGYMFFSMDENGHLIYLRTDQVDADFSLDSNGHLIIESV